MGVERLNARRDDRITRVMRVGECQVRLRGACACRDVGGTAEGAPVAVTASCPGTRLLEAWERVPPRCDCPWCRWEALVMAQRRALASRIVSPAQSGDAVPLPAGIMAAFARPALPELTRVAPQVIARLMGPSWWVRPSRPRSAIVGEVVS